MDNTLASLSPDRFLATLIRDYLADPAWLASVDPEPPALPPDTILPKLVMDNAAEPARPSLVIAARETEDSRGPRRAIMVNPMLLTWLQSDDPGAVDGERQTTAAEASAWLAIIDDRLRNSAAFSAWLRAQDPARLYGWTILKIVHKGAAPPLRRAGSREVNYALSSLYTLAVSRRV